MKRRLAAAAIAALGATACAPTPTTPVTPPTRPATSASPSPSTDPTTPAPSATADVAALGAVAVRLAETLARGQAQPLLDAADQGFRDAVTADGLTKALSQLTSDIGPYTETTGWYQVPANRLTIVHVVTKHQRASARFQFTFADDGRVAGMYFAPATDAEIAKAQGTQQAWPATGPHSVDTAVTVGRYDLGGTLTTPAAGEKRPIVVLLLAGSGAQDRDSTIGRAHNKPLRDIADGLAAHGISSLRFDKATKAVPTALPTDLTLDDEYFDDARAAIELLRARRELRAYGLFVLGHSQGAMVMPKVVADNRVDGGISLAGSPRNFFDISYDQQVKAIEDAPGLTDDQRKQHLDTARRWTTEAKAITDPTAEPPAEVAQMMPTSYIVSLNQLNPGDTAAALHVPLLFLQGDADFQVSPEADFGAWQRLLAGRDNVAFEHFDGLNHLFQPTTGKPGVTDYDAPAKVPAKVTDAIAQWLIGLP